MNCVLSCFLHDVDAWLGVQAFFFLNFVFGLFEKIEYIGVEQNNKKKEVEMSNLVKELERVKNLLEENLEEMKKIHEE